MVFKGILRVPILFKTLEKDRNSLKDASKRIGFPKKPLKKMESVLRWSWWCSRAFFKDSYPFLKACLRNIQGNIGIVGGLGGL